MSSDPAFLFFPGDWLGGTMLFSRPHKGAYMDLLMAQFNNGHMELQEIEIILGKDFEEMWESKLKAKFITDKDGKYYNEKLEFEINKRKKYTKSREKNLAGKKSHMEPHMQGHMENGNRNIYNKEIFNNIPIPKTLDTKECLKAIFDWFQYKADNHKPLVSIPQIELFFTNLNKYSDGNSEKAIDIINYSIDGTYPKIYEPKDNNNEPEKPKRIITKCPECKTDQTKTGLRMDRTQHWHCKNGHTWTTKVRPPAIF